MQNLLPVKIKHAEKYKEMLRRTARVSRSIIHRDSMQNCKRDEEHDSITMVKYHLNSQEHRNQKPMQDSDEYQTMIR